MKQNQQINNQITTYEHQYIQSNRQNFLYLDQQLKALQE